ncbi:PH domain-containing protein [Halosimplex aquaticum]
MALLYVGTLATDYQLFWYVPLLATPLIPVAAHLKWRSRGYALGDEHVVTRNGFWVRKQKVVPYHRVQTVFTTQTIFQRRRDLATVTVDTAGSQSITGDDAEAVDIDAETAERIRERVPDELYGALARRPVGRGVERTESRTDGPHRRTTRRLSRGGPPRPGGTRPTRSPQGFRPLLTHVIVWHETAVTSSTTT